MLYIDVERGIQKACPYGIIPEARLNKSNTSALKKNARMRLRKPELMFFYEYVYQENVPQL